MRCVALKGFGGREMLQILHNIPKPKLSRRSILLKVCATAVNRGDIVQRQGFYPPPPGASEILGLEAAGVVEAIGPNCSGRWKVGDRVMALLSGGGYAEYVAVHEGHCLPVPEQLNWSQAAAIPEVFLTGFQLLKFQAQVQPKMNVLFHAGVSGVGIAVAQLCKFYGASPAATCSAGKVKEAQRYFFNTFARDGPTPLEKQIVDGLGKDQVDIIIDPVFGNGYLEIDGKVLRRDGTVVVLGFMGGHKLDNFSATTLFRKNATIKFSTLRSQSDAYKEKLVAKFEADCLRGFSAAQLQPVIHSVLPLSEVASAHELVETNRAIGKVVLAL